MFPTADSDHGRRDEILTDRVEALAAWIQELDTRLRAAELTAGDEKTAKELRKAVEALAKHDPKLEDRLTNRVDVLKDRLATLADTVAATSAGLAAKDGEIIGLRRTLEKEHARLESLLAAAPKGGGPAAAELEELRKSVASLAAERPRRRLGRGERDDGADGKLEVVQQRLDMLAETVSATAAGLASRDGDLAALRRRLEEDGKKVEAALDELRASSVPLAELKLTVKEVSQQAAQTGRQNRRGVDGLLARVDAVTGQVDDLARTVATAADGLASGRQELETLRGSFDEETGRLDAHVAKIEQYLASLTPRLRALDGLPTRHAIETLGGQVQEASAAIDSFAGRLATLSQAVEETGQGYAERELELAALSRRFDEARAEVEALVAEVRQEVTALAEAGAGAQEEVASTRAELAQALEQVSLKIDAVERERAASQIGLEEALAASGEERGALAAGSRLLEERVQGITEALEALSARIEESGLGQAERDEELVALSRRFEEGRLRVDALVGDLRTAIETMPAPEPGRVDGIEAQVDELAQALEQVSLKIDAVERERAASQIGLEEALAASGEERGALAAGSRLLEERVQGITEALEALSARIEDGRSSVEGLVADMRAEVQGLADGRVDPELDTRLGGLANRLDAHDRRLLDLGAIRDEASEARAMLSEELTTLRGSVDEETGRLDAHVARIEQVLASLEPQLAALEALPTRDQVAGLEALAQQGVAARAELVEALEQVTRKVDAVERARAASQTRLEEALAASGEERGALAAGSRLLEERVQVITEVLEALSGRIEEGRADVVALATELHEAVDAQPADPAQATRLEVLAQAMEVQAASVADATEGVASGEREIALLRGALDALAGRLDELGTGVEAVAARPAGVAADRHEELAQRVEAIAAAVESRAASRETDLMLGKVLLRLDAIEREQQSLAAGLTEAASGSGSSEDAFAELRLLIENARTRIELLELAAHPSGTHVEHVPAQVVPIRGSEG